MAVKNSPSYSCLDIQHCNQTLKLFGKSPSLHPLLGPAFTPPPIPTFSGICKSKEILLNLSTKCWNSAFNAQGSRVIMVVVQVGAMKIYVAAVEALRKNERQDETQFTTKIGGKTSFGPNYLVL